jgi:hypothetical protein
MINRSFIDKLREERGLEPEATRKAYLALIQEAERLTRNASDVLYPDADEKERLEYRINQMMDNAHAIIDYAHDLKHAVLEEKALLSNR